MPEVRISARLCSSRLSTGWRVELLRKEKDEASLGASAPRNREVPSFSDLPESEGFFSGSALVSTVRNPDAKCVQSQDQQ